MVQSANLRFMVHCVFGFASLAQWWFFLVCFLFVGDRVLRLGILCCLTVDDDGILVDSDDS